MKPDTSLGTKEWPVVRQRVVAKTYKLNFKIVFLHWLQQRLNSCEQTTRNKPKETRFCKRFKEMKMMKQSFTLFEFVLVVIALNGKFVPTSNWTVFKSDSIHSFVHSGINSFDRLLLSFHFLSHESAIKMQFLLPLSRHCQANVAWELRKSSTLSWRAPTNFHWRSVQ